METLKHTLMTLTCLALLASCKQEQFPPANPNQPGQNDSSSTTPTPRPSVPPSPSPTATPGNGGRDPASTGDIDIYREVAEPMGQSVDNRYPASRELMVVRSFNTKFPVDTCDPTVQGRDRFADRIAYSVYKFMTPMKIDVHSSVAPIFGLNKDNNTYMPTSLLSHPFCKVTASTLQATYEGKNIPSAAVIAKAQQFTDRLNQYRNETLAGSREGQVKAYKLWSKFMMCIGYMESLTSADSAESDRLANSFGFRRPSGVNMHNDSRQTNADSVLGIGIFQVSNVVKWGDTYSCVMDWNRQFPSCKISPDVTKTGMIPVLASTYQTFNAYCGVSMVARMFGVQVNATRSKNTHPDNVKNGALKAPVDRCVSPFMNVNTSYNHYAPLQNGSGFTLDNILSCTLAAD